MFQFTNSQNGLGYIGSWGSIRLTSGLLQLIGGESIYAPL